MVKLKCPNSDCGREWEYTGEKEHPSYVSCPDCKRNVKIPKKEKTGAEV